MKMKSLIFTATIVAITSFFLFQPTEATAAPTKKCEQLTQQGQQFLNERNFHGAWIAFNEAIQTNPNDMNLYCYRGASSAGMGHFKASLADFDMAFRLTKNDEERGNIYYMVSFVYLGMGDPQNSMACLLTAAKYGNQLARNGCDEVGIPY